MSRVHLHTQLLESRDKKEGRFQNWPAPCVQAPCHATVTSGVLCQPKESTGPDPGGEDIGSTPGWEGLQSPDSESGLRKPWMDLPVVGSPITVMRARPVYPTGGGDRKEQTQAVLAEATLVQPVPK